MKASYLLSFLCGAAMMLGFSTLSGSNAESPQRVYELRLYHVHEGKMDDLKARFGDHTDTIFKRHNMRRAVPNNSTSRSGEIRTSLARCR
jgi:hypothetical protein